ncbi:MAG: CRISPR system precrRNA processing endoribonuclease RAMP protein Cas6 [Nitrospiraceae bacterium]|nr:CRISPR system precrRNA processing endoribonuclease RAMP protein Cas6 [Nitrospiraceae bacterium]
MNLTRYRIVLEPTTNLALPPYKGSTFRGGFGHALRRVMCVNRGETCAKCPLGTACVYPYIFETTSLKDGKSEDSPHPFIIEPPIDRKRHYTTDDTLDLHLILIGRAINYAPYFIFAFEELGRIGIGRDMGKYRIESVTNIGYDHETLIYDGSSHIRDDCQVINTINMIHETSQLNHNKITLRFLTPARIKYKGKLTKDLNFEIVLRNLLRRQSSLAEIHCDEKWDLNWKELIDSAKNQVKTTHANLRWHDWERYSQRQDTKLKMGGFLGEITFEGNLSEFLTFLKLGEYLHIGKGTVYGLGKYEIVGE